MCCRRPGECHGGVRWADRHQSAVPDIPRRRARVGTVRNRIRRSVELAILPHTGHCIVTFFSSTGIMHCMLFWFNKRALLKLLRRVIGVAFFYFLRWTASIKLRLLFPPCRLCFLRTFIECNILVQKCDVIWVFKSVHTNYVIIYKCYLIIILHIRNCPSSKSLKFKLTANYLCFHKVPQETFNYFPHPVYPRQAS